MSVHDEACRCIITWCNCEPLLLFVVVEVWLSQDSSLTQLAQLLILSGSSFPAAANNCYQRERRFT